MITTADSSPSQPASQQSADVLPHDDVDHPTALAAQEFIQNEHKSDALLQREIAALLEPEKSIAPEQVQPDETLAKGSAADDAISAADLDALISKAPIADLPPEKTTDKIDGIQPDVEATIAAAEDVVAEELSALLEQKLQAPPPAETPAAHAEIPAAPAPEKPAEPLISAASTVPQESPVAQPTLENPVQAAPVITPPPAQELVQPGKEKRKPPILRLVFKQINDVLLTGFQIIDLPFARIPESLKQMIGVAAVALLAGGIALLAVVHFQK